MKIKADKEIALLEILALLSPSSSKTTLRSWVKEGRVSIDGEPAAITATQVTKGQTVEVGQKRGQSIRGLKILFADAHIIVVEKPSGLLSVSTNFETKTTAHGLLKQKYWPKKVYIIHRLDQDTSGVMLFALTEQAYDGLKKTFEKHDIERTYVAIVEGHMRSESGTWECYLQEDKNYHMHSSSEPDEGELAITHYEVLDTTKKMSLVKLVLETGKKNQIRVHCRDAGHPVIGDKKYGAKMNPIKRLGLHSHRIVVEHPVTGKVMTFESPIPTSFKKLFGRIDV
jgi:tRNA pseudouridine32 synthase/23S rRNA pseudouridine746 synthase/23S rRNA pseudouridine1911/1915/1917 synthase